VAVLVALAVLIGSDGVLLAARVNRLDLRLSRAAGDTWVLVGLDSRSHVPAGAPADQFGSPEDVPGSRADVVIVVHRTPDGTSTFSVPRDLLVRTDRGPARLALSWQQGPRALIDALCSLGIPTGHLVSIDLAGFAALVDAVGGLDVDVPAAVRDEYSGLWLSQAGHQHVDGLTALALVRSRHPQHLVGGRWVPAPVDPDGRASTAGMVMTALHDALARAAGRPWRLQQAAWAASGAVAADRSTSFADLVSLARMPLDSVRVLPAADPVGASIARTATDATTAAVAAAGMSCDP
jgi:LCP family protein required for cell wall assembly